MDTVNGTFNSDDLQGYSDIIKYSNKNEENFTVL